jgi:glycosyltransferase involved in cell wall biosynthesis
MAKMIENSQEKKDVRRRGLMRNKLYMVIPCYNEQEVLPETSKRLKKKLSTLVKAGKIDPESRIIFVNDGSKDRTWEIIRRLHEEDPVFGGVNLSRNRGHQNALLAGLMTVKDHADMAISMDADLQDDINAIDEMVEKYLNGTDIVYGVRSSRAKDTFFKKATAEGFYKLMNTMGVNTVFNHADYRLMSKRALEGLAEFREVNLFLRGIVPMIGYSTDVVYYERGERFAGESKYPLGKMLSFAIEGITSLSTKPIRMITFLGFFIFLVSIGILIYSLVRHFMGATIVGWTTLMVSVWAIGGLILLSLGVVGEYIGKIYLETKARPRFLIEEFLNDTENAKKPEEKTER